MTEQFDRPRPVSMHLASMQRRDREDRQRCYPQRPACARLPPGDDRNGNRQHDVRIRQQLHSKRRWHGEPGSRGPNVQGGGRGADEKSRCRNTPSETGLEPILFAAQDGLDDDGGQEAERAESNDSERSEGDAYAKFRESVGRKRAQIPEQAKQGRTEQQRIDLSPDGRARVAAHDHQQQHSVEHDTGAQADEIEQSAHTTGSTLCRERWCREQKTILWVTHVAEQSISSNEWYRCVDSMGRSSTHGTDRDIRKAYSTIHVV